MFGKFVFSSNEALPCTFLTAICINLIAATGAWGVSYLVSCMAPAHLR